MDIELFLKLRKDYVDGGFVSERIALQLSTIMAKDPLRIPTGMEDGTSPVGYIALRPARYSFGEVRQHEVIQVCENSGLYILTSFPGMLLMCSDLIQSVEQYEVWLPLTSDAELLSALEHWKMMYPDEDPSILEIFDMA